MLRCWVEPDDGSKYELTQNTEYELINIEGLNPTGATINTYKVGISDGEIYNSSYVNTRNIVLYLLPRNNNYTIEYNRLTLYKYFRPKHKVRLYFQHDSRDVFIDGYVETMEISLYSQLQELQISIICPQPYFKDLSSSIIEFNQIDSGFEFPFSVDSSGVEFSTMTRIQTCNCNNYGDVETGMKISIYASGYANGIAFTLDDTSTFKLTDGLSLDVGDTLTINTNKGEKSVIKLDSNGETTNCINYVDMSSTWLTVGLGQHMISHAVATGYDNLEIRAEFYNMYIGL